MNPYENIDWMLNDSQHDGKPIVSRRLINTYIVVLKCDHYMMDDETVKLHELENGQWYKEDWKGRLSTFNADVALKLTNGG